MLKRILTHAGDNKQTVLFCGDLIHLARTDCRVTNGVTQVLQSMHDKYPDMNVILISGNHDQSGKNSLSTPVPTHAEKWQAAVRFSPSYSNVHYLAGNEDGVGYVLYNNPQSGVDCLVAGIDYLEHAEDQEHAIRAAALLLEQLKGHYTKSILLIHQSPIVEGAPFMGTFDPKSPLLEGWDIVFNGHIHNYEILSPNVVQVGIPMVTNDAEGPGCGFLEYDSARNIHRHVSTDGEYPEYTSDPNAEQGYYRPKFEASEKSTASSSLTVYAGLKPKEALNQYLNEVEQDAEVVKLALKLADPLWN